MSDDLGPAPHVVLLTAGDVLADRLVLEHAQSLAAVGLQVTALGAGAAADVDVAGVRVLRTPVSTGAAGRSQRLRPRRAVRQAAAGLAAGYGARLDELAPDAIQVHDLLALPAAAAAVERAGGRPVRLVLVERPSEAPSGRHGAALRALRRDHVPDVVLPASAPVAPPARLPAAAHGPLLVCPVGRRTTGLEVVVDALALLPEARLALLSDGAVDLAGPLGRARQRGVADRIQVADSDEERAARTAEASLAVLPLVEPQDHDLTLPTALSGMVAAALPVVAGQGRATIPWLAELGLGVPFAAGDPAALAESVRRVLADSDVYRARLSGPVVRSLLSRPEQAAELRAAYRGLFGPLSAADAGVTSLWVGPTNSAGQGYAWARALDRFDPVVRTEVWTLDRISAFVFPTDVRVPPESWGSRSWSLAHRRDVRRRFSHVLMESGLGVFGALGGGDLGGDLAALRQAGLTAGVAFHGSEVRSPRLHRQLEPTSPFRDQDWDLGVRLQQTCDRIMRQLEDFDGPRFVSTLDLVDYVPDAQWLPVVVDTRAWAPGPPVLERPRPVLLHVPSNPELKGSAVFEPIAQQLAERGLVEYRRVENVAVEDMPGLVRDADIVFDQFSLGLYGVQAAQAMATGRVVVSYVGDRIRGRLPVELPIVEASPQTLVEVVERLLDDRDTAREQAARGPEFVARFHDGRLAGQTLARWVHGSTGPEGSPA
jgi:hypothetical protein